jgi:hypothetical protein
MSWLGQNVDLGWGATLIRLATGAFFLPHAYVKLPWPGTIAFFQAAGFKPPAFWMYVANAIEAAVALSPDRNGSGTSVDLSTAYSGRSAAWPSQSTDD